MDEAGPTPGSSRPVELFGRFGVPALVAGVLVIGVLSGAVAATALSGSSPRPTSPRATSARQAGTVTSTGAPRATTTTTAPRSTTTSPPRSTTTTAAGPSASGYADQVNAVCGQYVPQLTEIVSSGIDGAILHGSEVKSLVSQMLSDVSAIPAPSGDGPVVTSWITDWEEIWSAALSENTRLFTSEIKTADSVASQLGLGPDCM